MEFFNEATLWLAFTYAVGSAVGWYMAKKSQTVELAENIIDSLIKDGYLKTRGSGRNLEVLKPEEWVNDQNTR